MGHSTRQRTSASTDKAWARGFLQEILKTQEESVPEGFYTAKQWAEMWGMSRDCASKHILIAIKNGLMEQRRIKIRCVGRNFYPVPHFARVSRKAQ